MKQKTITKSPITKEELTDVLKEYPTKKDLKKEINESENRLDKKFTQRLLDSQKAFRVELNHQFLVMDEKWERRFAALSSRLFSAIDPLLKELETRREDREIGTAQIRRISQLQHS